MAFFSDLLAGVKSNVLTSAQNSVVNITDAAKEKVSSLFKDVTEGAVAKIEPQGIKSIPAASVAQPAGGTAAINPLPSWAMPMLIIATVLIAVAMFKR